MLLLLCVNSNTQKAQPVKYLRSPQNKTEIDEQTKGLGFEGKLCSRFTKVLDLIFVTRRPFKVMYSFLNILQICSSVIDLIMI